MPTAADAQKARGSDSGTSSVRIPPSSPKTKEPATPTRRAGQPAYQTEHHRLQQELTLHVARACAQGLAQADFARPFCHAYEHDVHNADAADDERDGGDPCQQTTERSCGGRSGVDDILLRSYTKVWFGWIHIAACGEQGCNLVHHPVQHFAAFGFDQNHADAISAKAAGTELFENNRGGNVDAAIVIGRADDALLCHDADDGKARGADAHLLANRVDAFEQVFGDA